MRKCSTCKEYKELAQFSKDGSRAGGISYNCKECSKINSNRYAKKNRALLNERYKVQAGKVCPETGLSRGFIWHLKKTYGLTPEQYVDLLDKSEGKCGICKEPLTKPHLDHDHETGKIRGILCQQCNLALGLFKDDPDRLLAAVAYLGVK